MKPIDVAQLWELCRPVVEGNGYDLVEVEWKMEAGGWVLRAYIDIPEVEKGVTLEDCAKVSRELSPVLDVSDEVRVAYTLEVSSPGLNRPLRRESDFRRFVGKKAKIRTRHPVGESRRNFSGTLVGVESGRVRIDVGDATFDVPVDDVEKANLVFEF